MKSFLSVKKLSLLVVLAMSNTTAMAYGYLRDSCGAPQKWPTSSMTFNANPTGFSGVYAKWLTSFNVALTRINDTPANFDMYARLDDDLNVGIGNGESEIWWSTGTSAVEYTTTSSCGVTVETDIIFHNNIPNGGYLDVMDVKTNFRGYGLERRTFESTAIHEVGHALGLAHEARYYNIMGTDYTHLHTTGETALRSYMGEDATNAIIALYGGSTRQDLSVAAWRRVGFSGEYSSHGRTRLLDANGVELTATKVEATCTREFCEMRHSVSPGQSIQYEMTLENNGSDTQTVQLGYYVSTNATITDQDRLIGTDTVTVARNTPDTITRNVTIPADLLPETNYYIGVIIDNGGSVAEWDESNNTSYIHFRTASTSGGSAPTAEANGPYSGTTNVPIAFSSLGSTDSDGTIASYSWTFGDGSSSTVANPTKAYTAAGTYIVRLTVTDNDGLTSMDSATVTVTQSTSTLENACLTQGPQSANQLITGRVICVPTSTSSTSIQYYWIWVPSTTRTMTIETDYGTGNGNVFYNPSVWATSTAHQLSSTGPTNAERITVTNPAPGSMYQYVSVVGVRSGMALKVTLQ
ncbi:MAG: PKD domain-containing protein [Rhodanobacteraceae bacterium]|nr:PKD domain-containing protein [Rhodanobacteraceae bacterium]